MQLCFLGPLSYSDIAISDGSAATGRGEVWKKNLVWELPIYDFLTGSPVKCRWENWLTKRKNSKKEGYLVPCIMHLSWHPKLKIFKAGSRYVHVCLPFKRNISKHDFLGKRVWPPIRKMYTFLYYFVCPRLNFVCSPLDEKYYFFKINCR